MTYSPPGSGLGGAREKKIEASKRLKQPLAKPADLTPAARAAIAKKKETEAIRKEHEATQARLRAEYEASRVKPKPCPPPRMSPDAIVRMVDKELGFRG